MIKKLYEKSEIWFAVAWIIGYCVLASIGDNISMSIGVKKSVTLPILIILSIVLYLFVKKNGLSEKYGLCKSNIPASKMLFYVPILMLFTVNLWYGAVLNITPLESVLYVFSMLCVGFLEEMIFRGFLFKAMIKDGVNSAIIVSSITFGIGHIVNLINGSGVELLPNILQVLYAIAIGFMLVMIFHKTKSMLPCIVMHSIFNMLSTFANQATITPQDKIISALFIIIVSGGYALYIALNVKDIEVK